jgi:flagellin FlaB
VSWRDQRGITGLETAIVLIAFVVVSSVFAFAALSTGLFSSDKAKETIQAGLSETRGSMELKGSVILTSSTTGTSGVVSDIAFQVASAAGGESIDLTPGKTIIKYTDSTQSKVFDATTGFSVTALGTADTDKLLERNEVYEIKMSTLQTTDSGKNALTNQLMTNKLFSLEVIPPSGAVLFIERTTPVFLDTTTSLN